MTVEELQVLITAQTSGLQKEINGVKAQLTGLNKAATNTSNKMNGMMKSLSKSLKFVSFAAIGAGLVKLGKQAVATASDLQEVQNVVDVAFGDAAEEINKFASTAVKQLGMSELTAKRMASTFMSMSNGMDIAADSGKTMAVELTKLAGDMASFYNVEQDVAQTALNSVFTGETESLKKFGVVMSQANLDAFALSQGITKSYNSMSQAEKVMLRYQYVMKATSQAQGDFARTSGGWANQVRVLKEQWSQFLGILGNGLIQVLTPCVQVLNQLLGSLITIGNSISKVFGGKKITNAATDVKSAAMGAEDLSGSMGDAAGGVEDANNSAKKLQKTLGSFDELNIMADNSDDGSGGGGGGSVDIGSTITADTTETEEAEAGMLDSIKSFVDECKEIIDKWIKTIPKLEFHFDKEKVLEDLRQTGLNIVNTIAGWGTFFISLGIQVANDLDLGALLEGFTNLLESATNLASKITDALVPALMKFYETSGLQTLVQWIGEKLKNGMDGIATRLDAWASWFEENKGQISAFAENLGKAVQPLVDIVIQIGDAAWSVFATTLGLIDDALKSIADVLINMDASTLTNIVKGIVAIGQAFIGIKIADYIIGFKGLWTSIQNGYPILSYLGDLIKAPFQLLGGWLITLKNNIMLVLSAIGQMFTSIGTFVSGVVAKIGAFLAPVWAAIKGFFVTFGATIAGIGSVIGGVVAAVAGFFKMWTEGWNLAGELLKDFGIALAVVGAIILGVAAWPAVIVGAIVAAVSTIIIVCKDHWAEISAFFTKVGKWIGDFFSDLWKDITEWFSNAFDKTKEFFGDIVDGTKEFISGVVQSVSEFLTTLSANIAAVFSQIKDKTVEIWNAIKEFFSNWWSNTVQFFQETVNALSEFLSKAWDGIKTTINNVWNAIKDFFTAMWASLTSMFTTAVNNISTFLSNSWNTIKTVINNVWNAIKQFFSTTWEGIKTLISNAINSIKTSITNVFNGIKTTLSNIMNSIKSNISTALENIKNLWSGMCTGVKTLVSNLSTGLSTIVNNIKTTFVNVFTSMKTSVTNVFNGMKTSIINVMNAIKTGIKTPVNGIIGFINGLVSGIVSGINGMIGALNKLSFDVPSWVPEIGGKTFGFNIGKISAPQIPLLANGGVITSPTVAMMGEYAGASHNPEIVAPQSILRQTMAESNEDLIDTLIQLNKQLISAITSLDMEVKIGDDTIASSVKRANDKSLKMTGYALI